METPAPGLAGLRPEDHPGAWSAEPPSGPLRGVRILDLSKVLAGPLCTCILGDLGAQVVKVEKPGSGDETRRWGPPFHGDDAAYWFAINRNRRSVACVLMCRKPSARGGKHKGDWVIRSDRRDRRQVFFQDPGRPATWHALRWNGLPPEGEIPAFSDKTADELLREARAAGLSPKSDDALLPVLLRLLGGAFPVSRWPSQMGKKEKKGLARETAQGDQAARDRNGPAPAEAAGEGTVVPLRWPGQASRARDAIAAERRRRREQAVPQRPAPPGTLGDRLRATSLLALPDEDEE